MSERYNPSLHPDPTLPGTLSATEVTQWITALASDHAALVAENAALATRNEELCRQLDDVEARLAVAEGCNTAQTAGP